VKNTPKSNNSIMQNLLVKGNLLRLNQRLPRDPLEASKAVLMQKR